LKKLVVFLTLIALFLTGCTTTPIKTSSTEWGSTAADPEADKKSYEEAMKNKILRKSYPSVSRFLTRFRTTFSYFEFVPVYRFNFYGNSRTALFWERAEAIFNCSIIDDEELIKTLKKTGFSQVTAFSKKGEFAWKEFENKFVNPKYFEMEYTVENIVYYNRIVICEPFDNPDAKENEKVVFYDCVCKNRQTIYEKTESSYNDRPYTCLLESSLEWKLIEHDY